MASFCCATPEELAESCDVVVLMTEWPQYLEMDWSILAGLMQTPLVLDGRCALDPAHLTRAGFRYTTLAGWNPVPARTLAAIVSGPI